MKKLAILSCLLIHVLLTACGALRPEPETYTVGVIILLSPFEDALQGIKDELVKFGYVEGENITFIYDGALGDLEAVEAAVESYVEADVDAIISISTPPTQIVKEATTGTGIPVVFGATDPVGAGLVDDMTHPGGNLTGIATGFAEDVRLEWLLRVVPEAQKIYAPYNPDDRSALFALDVMATAAQNLGVEVVSPEVHTPEDVTLVIENIPADVDAIFLLPDSLVSTKADDWSAAALERKLPLSPAGSPPSRLGELISYGFTSYDAGKQLAHIVAQVLTGENPADLPIEAVEFYMGINLQTAKAIGLEIPDEIIQAADHIIRE